MMPAREAGDRVHMRVGQHPRPSAGIEFAADVGEMLAGVKVEMDLAVGEEVVHWGVLLWNY